MTGCTSGGYDQLDTSPEAIEQELQPAVCEHRHILFKANDSVDNNAGMGYINCNMFRISLYLDVFALFRSVFTIIIMCCQQEPYSKLYLAFRLYLLLAN